MLAEALLFPDLDPELAAVACSLLVAVAFWAIVAVVASPFVAVDRPDRAADPADALAGGTTVVAALAFAALLAPSVLVAVASCGLLALLTAGTAWTLHDAEVTGRFDEVSSGGTRQRPVLRELTPSDIAEDADHQIDELIDEPHQLAA